MTTNIEPTEEQKQAAVDCYAQLPLDNEAPDGVHIGIIARLLAEREHEAAAAVTRVMALNVAVPVIKERDQLRADLDAARAEVARLQALFDDAGHGEHNVLALVDHYQSEALKSEQLQRDLDAARARIAELEGQYSRRVQSHTEDLKEAQAREAAHLAHIKALREVLHDLLREAENAPDTMTNLDRRCLDAEQALADTVHYDVEGGEG